MYTLNTANKIEALTNIMAHPLTKELITKFGFIDESLEYVIGYNSSRDEVYLGLGGNLCLFAPEFRPEQVGLVYQCPDSGEEYFDSDSLTSHYTDSRDDVDRDCDQWFLEAIQHALQAMKDFEQASNRPSRESLLTSINDLTVDNHRLRREIDKLNTTLQNHKSVGSINHNEEK